MSLQGKIWVRENLHSEIFYAVVHEHSSWSLLNLETNNLGFILLDNQKYSLFSCLTVRIVKTANATSLINAEKARRYAHTKPLLFVKCITQI